MCWGSGYWGCGHLLLKPGAAWGRGEGEDPPGGGGSGRLWLCWPFRAHWEPGRGGLAAADTFPRAPTGARCGFGLWHPRAPREREQPQPSPMGTEEPWGGPWAGVGGCPLALCPLPAGVAAPRVEGNPCHSPRQEGSAGRDGTVPYPCTEDGGVGSLPWLCRSGLVPSRAAGGPCPAVRGQASGQRDRTSQGSFPQPCKENTSLAPIARQEQVLSQCPGCVAWLPCCGSLFGARSSQTGPVWGQTPSSAGVSACSVLGHPEAQRGAELSCVPHPRDSVSPAAAQSCPCPC